MVRRRGGSPDRVRRVLFASLEMQERAGGPRLRTRPRRAAACPCGRLARRRFPRSTGPSNRTIEEWSGLFDNPVLGNGALDRLANASYQITIEGASYRERQSPHRRKKGVDTVT